MRTLLAPLIVCATCLALPLAASAQVMMAWSPVDNPGNPADTTVMNDGTTGYGSVAYNYSIGTYDVTVSQYVAFLNSNDPTGADTLGLYNSYMSSTPVYADINYNSGAANGGFYSAISGDGNHPVNFVSFYDTLRFANWLNNGQVPGSTETGAYTLLGGTPTPSNGDSITRNAGATNFLPSENEWYKAAYYNPGGVGRNSYFQYPTSSNTAPAVSAPTATPNSANFIPGGPSNLTNVGAYSGTTSPYGAYDMAGNVWQWNEALISDAFRGLRGGSFFHPYTYFALSLYRVYDDAATDENAQNGFRVANYPTPTLPGDVNLDGTVNGLDIAAVSSHWLNVGFATAGDANHDGVVNGLDIALIASHWLQTAGGGGSGTAVPEPSSLILATLSGLVLLACRRRS